MAEDNQGCKRGSAISEDEPTSKRSKNTLVEKPASKGPESVSKDELLSKWKSPVSVSEDERRLAAQSTEPELKFSRSVSEGEQLSAQSKSIAVGKLALKRVGSFSEDDSQKKRTKNMIQANSKLVITKSEGQRSEQSMMVKGEGKVPRSVTLPIDLVQDILLRLPSTAILRFRSVCWSWYAMLTNSQFLHEHHQLQQAQPLLIYCDHTSSQLTVRVDSSDLYRCENGQVFHYNDASAFQNASFQVCGSCNGLLLISHGRDTFICNPCTRRWAVIPRFKVLGFYSISDEYRILHAYADFTSRRSMVLGERKNRFYIYDVTSHSDRHLDCPTASEALQKEIEKSVHLLVKSKSAMFNASLHWWLPSTRKIVIFHAFEEQFQFMKGPAVDTTTWSPFCVIDSKLSLGVIDETMQSLDVWTLQDYYAENWSVKFRIELAAPSWGMVNNEEISPVYLLSERENLIMLYMDHFVHARFTTDLMVKKVYYTPKHKAFLVSYLLKPTLVPHAFLDHYDDDKLPRDRVYPQVFRNRFPFFKCLVSETKYFENAVIISGSLSLVDVLRSICHNVTKIYELESGNSAFKKKDYKTAIKHYTEAVKNKEDNAITAKRAVSFLNIEMFHECICDCDMILEKREGICSNVVAKSLGTKGIAVSKLAKSSEDFDVGIGLMQEASALTENTDFKGFLAKALTTVENAKSKFLEKAMNEVAHASKLDQ